MSNAQPTQDPNDPRCRRTRAQLQRGLAGLLERKPFERISVAEIAEAAALNRVTFYAHYSDKSALLDDLVTARFDELLARRAIPSAGTCDSFLPVLILAVCDYLAAAPWIESGKGAQVQPHLEAAVAGVIRRKLLEGMRRDEPAKAGNDLIASAVGWAIYGAAKEGLAQTDHCPSRDVVERIAALVAPLLERAAWVQHEITLPAVSQN